MSDFMIVELDDRYEFAVPMLDGDVINEDREHQKACCGIDVQNTHCYNWVDCGTCPACLPKEE